MNDPADYAAVDLYGENLLQSWPAEELLAGNLEALREKDEVLAGIIAAVEIPETVRMVVAHDGSVSFRLYQADGRSRWLGFSSVPLITAQANAKRTTLSDGNLAMDGIGNGADIEAILKKMSRHHALLVTESDALNINLVLRLRDLTEPIRSGRLVILHGGKTDELLEEFLTTHRGYNLVDMAITWPWRSDRENQAYAQMIGLVIDRCNSKILGDMNVLLERQKEYDSEVSLEEIRSCLSGGGEQNLRVINCTDTFSPTDYCTSRDALAGLGQLGASTDWLVLDRPTNISMYAQLERIERVKPHLILLVDMLRGDLPLNLPESVICVSLLNGRGSAPVKADLPGKNDFVFCSTCEQVKEFHQSGLPEDRVVHLPSASNTELFFPTEINSSERDHYGSDVVLIGNRWSTDPEDYLIRLPTHQRLWQTVIEDIKRSPNAYNRSSALQYLIRAQRCGVELREDDLRTHFTDLIQNYLGDSVLRELYCEELIKQGFNLRIWSWAHPADEPNDAVSPAWADSSVSDYVAGTIGSALELNKLYNAGKIFLYISSDGYIDQHMVDAAAAGAFMIVRSHSRDRNEDGIASIFEPGREIITFESSKDLVRKVNYFLSHEQERQAIGRLAREKILAQYSYQYRMRQMLDAISAGIGETEQS